VVDGRGQAADARNNGNNAVSDCREEMVSLTTHDSNGLIRDNHNTPRPRFAVHAITGQIAALSRGPELLDFFAPPPPANIVPNSKNGLYWVI